MLGFGEAESCLPAVTFDRKGSALLGEVINAMTILDACVAILRESKEPLSAENILDGICQRKLFEFKAKDRVGMVRSAIRRLLVLRTSIRD